MRTTVKKLRQLLDLIHLNGRDPNGKNTTLCDAFYIDMEEKFAKVSALDKTSKMYINAEMEIDTSDAPLTPETSRIPIDYEDITSKIKRFADGDIISIQKIQNATTISRAKPKKTFTINDPINPITSYSDPKGWQFVFNPVGLELNGSPFNVVIKTTAEAMLDVIEDAEPFYQKVQDLQFPLTITNDSVKLEIGNKTVGSVESELQVTSISTPIQKKAVFGPGLHNIFNALSGGVTLYFGEVKGATKMNPAMVVVWENGGFKAFYILRGYL